MLLDLTPEETLLRNVLLTNLAKVVTIKKCDKKRFESEDQVKAALRNIKRMKFKNRKMAHREEEKYYLCPKCKCYWHLTSKK